MEDERAVQRDVNALDKVSTQSRRAERLLADVA
jgi:hypothetical protein